MIQMDNKKCHFQHENIYLDADKLNALQVMLCSKMENLIDALNVKLYKSKKMFYGICPIHNGDNQSALNLYIDGETVPGYWKCNTKKCHEYFKKTIIGFVRGVLSHQKYGWSYLKDFEKRKNQKTLSWKESVDWCCNFIGQDIKSIKVDKTELEKRKFITEVNSLTKKPKQEKVGITKKVVQTHLDIPSKYFLNRGYSSEILKKYDVGLYKYENMPLSNRVAVPVYDNEGKFVVGFTGRSIYSQCEKCSLYHNPSANCPKQIEINRSGKWYNHNFNKESYLYNYWFAKKQIKDSGIAILVEGPGDVWRLVESGFENTLGLFGCSLSDEQSIILETSGCTDIIIVLDNDVAGQKGKEELKKRLSRSFRLHFIDLESKDVGLMTKNEINLKINPIVKSIEERQVR